MSWLEQAKVAGLPTFPIKISRARNGKNQKIPLTKHGHLDATFPPDPSQPWARANGYGITMGGGRYALDIDAHKPNVLDGITKWIADRHVPKDTRQHKTISGGWHLIFFLPEEFRDLPSRANIVNGLDSRGAGGWIAFGEGYKLIRDVTPKMLPEAVCEEIQRGANGGVREVDLADYSPPDTVQQAVTLAKLKQVIGAEQKFHLRWNGNTALIKEAGRSRSSMDFSTAHMLAMLEFTEAEIVWLLLTQFEHGQARWLPDQRMALRAAGRAAAKAIANAKAHKAMVDSIAHAEPEETPDMAAAMAAIMKGS